MSAQLRSYIPVTHAVVASADACNRKSWSVLNQRAIKIFPREQYLDPRAVRHARRQWIKSVLMLRSLPRGWVDDGKIGWTVQKTQ